MHDFTPVVPDEPKDSFDEVKKTEAQEEVFNVGSLQRHHGVTDALASHGIVALFKANHPNNSSMFCCFTRNKK